MACIRLFLLEFNYSRKAQNCAIEEFNLQEVIFWIIEYQVHSLKLRNVYRTLADDLYVVGNE